MKASKILVVDDEESILNLLRIRLTREGDQVVCVSSADLALQALKKDPEISLLITDLRMPEKNGFELMKEVREFTSAQGRTLKVMVITGHGEKEAAVQSLRLGAIDYLEKPFEMDDFVHSVERAKKEIDLEKKSEELLSLLKERVQRAEKKNTFPETGFVESISTAMNETQKWMAVLSREAKASKAEEPSVLILGETGTGKEEIARQIVASSRRSAGAFLAVNCANFSKELLESELFGHEKGAFTGALAQRRGLFELAKGGTLFLDEIGEMEVSLQAKLLRVLQEKTFTRLGSSEQLLTDVRIIAATHQNLSEQMSDGGFREDLYHRLSKVVITLPPLRDRLEDIEKLSTVFAKKQFELRHKEFFGLSEDALEALKKYAWPGNVRELLNVIERLALVFTDTRRVEAKDLSLNQKLQNHGSAPQVSGSAVLSSLVEGSGATLHGQKKEFERERISQILAKNNGNVTVSAKEAGMNRTSFIRSMNRFGIKSSTFKK